MFCPNCGEKLDSQNQKFCSSCGSVLLHTPDAPQLRAVENQVSSTVRSVPVYPSKPINIGGPGPYSKNCFALAIISIALAITGFIFGGINLIRNLLPIYLFPYYPGGPGVGLVGLTIAIVLNIGGLIFGILSKVNSSKAGKNEPINTLEKVGSVFAVFGIIINSIFIVAIIVVVIIRVISLVLIAPYYI